MARKFGLGGGVAVLACVIFTGCQSNSGTKVANNNTRPPAVAKQTTTPINNFPTAGAGNFNASAGGAYPTTPGNVGPAGASGPQAFSSPANANRPNAYNTQPDYPMPPVPSQPGLASPGGASSVPPPPALPGLPPVPPIPQQSGLAQPGIGPIQ